jgi:hypothetical protein
MRKSDRRRLAKPYRASESQPERKLARALGVETPYLDRLTDQILSDFDMSDTDYGIGWWAQHSLGTQRRILISDHLFSCVTSVATNLVEAELHRLELLDYSEQVSDLLADSVRIVRGEAQVKLPRRRSASEDALERLEDLHIVGTVRALSGALDCLGAALIGVLALPSNLLKSDLGKAQSAMTALQANGSEARSKQIEARTAFEASISGSGPVGWLDWVIALRNMLVHRGRRLSFSQLVPREPVRRNWMWRRVIRVRVVHQLPRDAGRSDIEVFLDDQPPVLTEDAPETVKGILRSTHELVERASQVMLEIWEWRRQNPAGLPQPRAQWPAGRALQAISFQGYAEGTFPYDPSLLTSNLVLHRRMRAAALPDPVRHKWAEFD